LFEYLRKKLLFYANFAVISIFDEHRLFTKTVINWLKTRNLRKMYEPKCEFCEYQQRIMSKLIVTIVRCFIREVVILEEFAAFCE